MEEMYGYVQNGFSGLNVLSSYKVPFVKIEPFVPYKSKFGDVPFLSVIIHEGKEFLVWPGEDDVFTAIELETGDCWHFDDIEVEVVRKYYPTSIKYQGLESTDREDITLVGNNKVWE